MTGSGDSNFELAKLMGIRRKKAVDYMIETGGKDKLTSNDFRCDAEQVEMDNNGKVTHSMDPKYTNPKYKKKK